MKSFNEVLKMIGLFFLFISIFFLVLKEIDRYNPCSVWADYPGQCNSGRFQLDN